MGEHPVLAGPVRLPVAGRHRRQAGAPHQLEQPAGRALRPRLRRAEHRVRGAGARLLAAPRPGALVHVPHRQPGPGRLPRRPLANLRHRHAQVRPRRRHRGTARHLRHFHGLGTLRRQRLVSQCECWEACVYCTHIHWNGKNNLFRFSLFSLEDFFWKSGKVIFFTFQKRK